MNAIQTDYSGVPYVEVETRVGTIRISDKDIANPGDFDGYDHLFALGDQFGTICLAYARCEKDAIDEMIDAGKLDNRQVQGEELQAMSDEEIEELLCAGNASEYFRQDYLWVAEVPKPAFSLVALLAYQQETAAKDPVPA